MAADLPHDSRRQGEPIVAIVTVLYNSAGVLPAFIASLEQQTLRNWTLIAVDNASADNGSEQLRALADARVIIERNPTNRGFAAASNQGIRLALDRGIPWVLILNNDTSFAPDFLQRLMARAGRGDAAVIAPRIVYKDAPSRNWYAGGHFSPAWGFRATHEGEGRPDDPSAPPERWVSFAPGCCKLVASDLLRTHGMFDPDYFVYWEDTDLCWRWREAGVRILYVREPHILHEVSALTGGERSPFAIRMYHKNQLIFLRKHFGRAATGALVLPVLMKILGRLLLGRDRPAEVGMRLKAIAEGWSAAPLGRTR